MSRRLPLAPHLSLAELEQRYRACRAGVERTHWQIIWLVAQGRPATEVAPLVGYTAPWVRELVHRYNAEGPNGLRDRRRTNRGRAPLLAPDQHTHLQQALAGPAPDGGLWTSRTVAIWLGERLGRPVSPQRAWEAMRAVGFTPQRPRPRATTAAPKAQAAFKKGGSRPQSMR